MTQNPEAAGPSAAGVARALYDSAADVARALYDSAADVARALYDSAARPDQKKIPKPDLICYLSAQEAE